MGTMLLTGLQQRLIGATLIGLLTALSTTMLSMLAPERGMVAYRSAFTAAVALTGAFSTLGLLWFSTGSRRLVFAPRTWNWWLLVLSFSGVSVLFGWLLLTHSSHLLAAAHLPAALGLVVLVMYRVEAAYDPVEPVQIRELTEAEWDSR